jgi:glycosyltransferase involved in cell wall biosynthesis
VPAEKVSVVPTCISPLFRRVNREFNDERPTVLQVGTAENKNLVRVASALAGLPCHLRVIGSLSAAQERALQGAGVSYSTATNLGEDALFDEYVHADVVAFVSTYEGFGMPIIEGNTVGRPVVTSNVASMPEIAGRAAALVDPFDVGNMREGFRRVVRDRAYRDALVEAGFENARRFSAPEVALGYSRLYHRIAGNDRDGGRAWR